MRPPIFRFFASAVLLLLVAQAAFPSAALASCSGGSAGNNAQGSCVLDGCTSSETNVGTCKTQDTGTTGSCCVQKPKSDTCTVSIVSTPGVCRKDGCQTGETAWGNCTDANDAAGNCCIAQSATSCTVTDVTGASVTGFCQTSCPSPLKEAGSCSGGKCCVQDTAATSYFNTYGYNPPLGQSTTIPTIIAGFLSAILPLVGALFFVMFLWGGVQWMTAGGDAKKLGHARSTLVNAAIGITIVILAYAIVAQIIKVLGAAG